MVLTGSRDARLQAAAYWLTFAAAMAPLVSIAATNILAGAALLATLAAYRRLDMPPRLTLPLLVFIAGTLIAVALSSDPRAGWPQLKKFWVYLSLPLMYTVFRGAERMERLIIGWTLLATASAVWSFVQFGMKRQFAIEHGIEFYRYYVGQRATGFMSHWMTFGAEQMIVFLMLIAALSFGAIRMRRGLLWAAAGVIGVSIAISFARSAWLGTAVATIYLVAAWRPRLLFLAPFAVSVAWFAAPRSVQQRVISIYQPNRAIDSNEHRYITRAAGVEMVKSSPWVGIGPEIVGRDFDKYVPAHIARPLPEGFYGHLHNLYLQYAAERGIPTLLAFLWFIGAAFVHLARSAVRHRSAFAHGGVAVVIAILTEGFFEVNLGDSEVLRMFLTVVACAYAGEQAGKTVPRLR
jgi:putative inorganic carbon (hco3(-)) transporter